VPRVAVRAGSARSPDPSGAPLLPPRCRGSGASSCQGSGSDRVVDTTYLGRLLSVWAKTSVSGWGGPGSGHDLEGPAAEKVAVGGRDGLADHFHLFVIHVGLPAPCSKPPPQSLSGWPGPCITPSRLGHPCRSASWRPLTAPNRLGIVIRSPRCVRDSLMIVGIAEGLLWVQDRSQARRRSIGEINILWITSLTGGGLWAQTRGTAVPPLGEGWMGVTPGARWVEWQLWQSQAGGARPAWRGCVDITSCLAHLRFQEATAARRQVAPDSRTGLD
jgi:hypothetical protein